MIDSRIAYYVLVFLAMWFVLLITMCAPSHAAKRFVQPHVGEVWDHEVTCDEVRRWVARTPRLVLERARSKATAKQISAAKACLGRAGIRGRT